MFARLSRLFRGFLGLFISGSRKPIPRRSWKRPGPSSARRWCSTTWRSPGWPVWPSGSRPGQGQGGAGAGARAPDSRESPAGNLELAGTLARELQELKADLTVDTQELKETEEAYEANLRQAKLAQREFEDKVRRAEKQLSQVKIKEAQAEAASALSNVAFKVGDLGDTMKTVEEVLQKRYEVSAGKARLARDMVDIGKVQEKENERKALEQVALAEFLASQGIQATPAAEGTAPATTKEIGPQ
jgi:hypothetical protein